MRKIREEVDKIKSIMGVVGEAKRVKYLHRTKQQPKFPIKPKKMQKLINNQFPLCSGNNYPCVGKITDEDCKTDYGVIGGDFSEKSMGLSPHNWSVVNRFDTNSLVHDKMWEIYSQTTEDISFENWIIDGIKELVNGKWTSMLAAANRSTIERGLATEGYAIQVIREIWGEKIDSITQHCAGDVRDRYKGQDLDVVIEGINNYFQIKPLSPSLPLEESIKKFTDERGYFYEVVSYHHSDKYNQDDVDVIMYVKENEKKYILFDNIQSKISSIQVFDNRYKNSLPQYLIRYYEEPIVENLNLPVIEKPDKVRKKSLDTGKERKIEYYKNRLSFFQDLINKLENPEI